MCECRGGSEVVCEWGRDKEDVWGVRVIGRRGCVRKWSRESTSVYRTVHIHTYIRVCVCACVFTLWSTEVEKYGGRGGGVFGRGGGVCGRGGDVCGRGGDVCGRGGDVWEGVRYVGRVEMCVGGVRCVEGVEMCGKE